MTRGHKWEFAIVGACIVAAAAALLVAQRRVHVDVPQQEQVIVDPPEVQKVAPAALPPSQAGMEEKG